MAGYAGVDVMIADLKFGPHSMVNEQWVAADVFTNHLCYCLITHPAPHNDYHVTRGTDKLYNVWVYHRGVSVELFEALDELTAECVLIEMEKKYNGDVNKASVRATNNKAHPHASE
jgi:hypothetical protein